MSNQEDHLAYGHYYNQDSERVGQGEGTRGLVGDAFNMLKSQYKHHGSQSNKPQDQGPPQQQFSQDYNPGGYGNPGQSQSSAYQEPGYQAGKPPKQDKVSALFDKLQGTVAGLGAGVAQRLGTAIDPQGYAQYGAGKPQAETRFGSFAPPRHGNDVKWYVDGCSYFLAVSKALETARESIWILDWWLSPELYLRRPPAKNEQYRLDRMLQAAAQRGVKVNIIVYKEVTQALTLSSAHTKHHLEALHQNIAVFRHPDHLPDRQELTAQITSSLENMSLDALKLTQLSADAIKGIYGIHEDIILYWAHHEKLCIIDGGIAFMGGLDMCFGRWDTHQHALADLHNNPSDIVFPGQDYNNARVLDFTDVANPDQNKLDRSKTSRMGWSDISVSLHGQAVGDLRRLFVERWNFIYDTKYQSRKDARFTRLALYGRPTSSSNQPNQPPQQATPPPQGTPQQPAGYTPQPTQQSTYQPQSQQPTQQPTQQQNINSPQPQQPSSYSPQPPQQNTYQPQTQQSSFPPQQQQQSSYQPQSQQQASYTPQPQQSPYQPQPQEQGSYQQHAPQQGAYQPSPQQPQGQGQYQEYPGSQQAAGQAPQQNYTPTGQPFPPPPPGPPPSHGQGQSQGQNQSQAPYFPPPPTQPAQDSSYAHSRVAPDYYGEHEHGDRERGSSSKPGSGSGSSSSFVPRRFRDNFDSLRGELAGQIHQYQDRFATGNLGRPQQQGNMTCQIVRSCSKWSNGTPTEHSIADAYAEIIRRSEHFIYIENQFFITATSDAQKPVKNKIGAAIVERILRAARAGQKWKMIIVIPTVPCFAGDLADESSLGTRAIMEFQYNSINRGGNSIMELIAKEGYNPMDYIRFYNLRNYDRIKFSAAPEMASQAPEPVAPEPGNVHRPAFDTSAPYQTYSPAPPTGPKPSAPGGTQWDSVSACYMLNGPDLRNVPWDGPREAEIDAFVTEELYVHSKVMIADDRVVICGSANLNDRSQLGDHDSEIAVIIEDMTPIHSTMDGKPYTASRFAASLRRFLFRKHLGLLPPQDYEHVDDHFDFDSPESKVVADPLADTFLSLWNTRARTNTEVFREVFHSVPDDSVRSWAVYKEFYGYYFKNADKQAYGEAKDAPPAPYKYGHVISEKFPGPDGVSRVKELLGQVKGTLVEMPLMFLIEEDVAESGLALNDLTEPLYT
ncbi:hypothetical protein P175DRAFT_0505037 [Aspergillus ochraceoroseus IBT 24754]|uniref:phospholipase D n=2 Tax=Aspergillus ochraceoroseus TaxID=138278 RepID=A0A2T5LLW6_9EURO|nr:uncharacterized protein P175DRAFT_0505037 [Aspergillus ochraceoroseus IBT 24754]KKK18333.1 hypothetical protein AOCH_005957 [Aspergillus ochraceoroseus]PTU17276.1 hypothetical protein P175DRAFT_0505037 [Aspergillus ochraceoroseus IBT 24754]